jgi:hypothetical protein
VLDAYQGLVYEEMIRYDDFDSRPVEEFFRDLRERFERLGLVPIPTAGSTRARCMRMWVR